MRILHACSWFQPQLGYSEFHLPMAQQRLGFSVAILTSDRYYPFPDYEKTVQPFLGTRVVGTGASYESELWTYRLPVAFEYRHHLWLMGIERVISDFKPDIIHVYQTFTFPTLQIALLKRKYGFGLITRSTMEKEVFFPQSRSRRLFYWFFTKLAAPILRQHVDCFTAVGKGAREIVSDVIKIPVKQIEVVPLGADSERFRFDAAARQKIRNGLNIPDDMVIAIYAGKLIPSKDVHILVKALSQVKGTRPLGVLLVGHGSENYREQLSEIAKTSNKKLIFCPPVPNNELNRYFSAADIGVWPSESSNAAIEAALVGLPIVVSAIDATKHYIEADNGLSFPRGDIERLAQCLELLANDSNLRKKMGESGTKYIKQNLSWNAIAQDSLKSYKKICEASSKGFPPEKKTTRNKADNV
jgi:glycosyltransferase involved in cell wall biosynthesis